jgi:hypothetical protein
MSAASEARGCWARRSDGRGVRRGGEPELLEPVNGEAQLLPRWEGDHA